MCSEKGKVYKGSKMSNRPGPLAQSDACPPGNQTLTGSIPGPANSSVEIWSLVISTAILSLPLIQVGQLSVAGEIECALCTD